MSAAPEMRGHAPIGIFTAEAPRCSRADRGIWSAEDLHSLVGDLETRVFTELPDDTWVYPGHGDDTTVGTERPSVPEWHRRG